MITMNKDECTINGEQSALSDGDKFTIEGVGIDSLGRSVMGGVTYDGKKAKGKVKLTVFTAKIPEGDL